MRSPRPAARVILLSPIAHARLGPPWPDPAPHNAMLERYARSIAEVAHSRGALFIDLFEPLRLREGQAPISDDGIHPNEAGYRFLAGQIVRGLDGAFGRGQVAAGRAGRGRRGPIRPRAQAQGWNRRLRACRSG